ncbi:MAG: APC family permease [Actinobacteria bacterium]|nr:MAG: APC family permease [Actinomycetota bacterium]
MRAGALRRQLGLLGTVSVSVGVMAPTLAMSATGVEPARLLGRAAPLAYVVAAIGVGLVAYGFTRLAGAFSSAGSVYAFAGRTLGPRAGFVTGWALLGTYLVFPAVSISAIAIFGQAFLKSTGIAPHAPWFPIALAGWAVIGWIASREIRTAARSLLAIEVASMALILVLMAIIVVKLATGGAPHGQALSLDVFALPSGTALSTVALAATFGFLSFAGFEAAGSLGEESDRPTSAIPRSLVAAIAVGAVFYVACEAVQTLGFGLDRAGTKAFAGSQAPLSDLAGTYVGAGLADVLSLAAVVSAVGAGLGCASVAARMLYALGRDRRLPETLAGVSGTGAPAAGLAFVLTLDLLGLIAFAAAGTPAQKVFFYLATIGVLELLVMYAITNVAAVRFLLERGRRREALLPIAGIAVAGYVFYRNVWPVPDPPFNLFPYVVAAWLAIGVAVALSERAAAPRPTPRRWRRA